MDVDDASAKAYRALPGPLGDRLRQVLREENSNTVMTITDGRCPMWRQDGLCRIQAELGHDALCQTCREFPRLRHDYGDFVELDLELSCPEAARLIFASPARHMTETIVPGGDPPEYDVDAMTVLRRSRAEILAFLQAREYSLGESLAIMLLFAHGVQSEIDDGDITPFEPADCLALAKQHAHPGNINLIYDFFSDLQILTPRWQNQLDKRNAGASMNESLRSLAVYGIQRYWLQAVSDLDLICRVKFIIIACLMVNAIGECPAETAQLFSKEIENDPDNLESILDGAYTNPAFTDMQLLGLLLNPQKN